MDFASLYNKMEEEAKAPDRFKQESSFKDPNIYKISKDSEGNGTVTIRFLPSFNKDKTQLQTTIMKKVHNLQWERLLPGKDKPERRWKPEFICPKTFGKDESCPVCDFGWDKYNELKEDGVAKEVYDNYRQKFTNNEKILTNIMVIKDDINPTNNGKIFIFELSKTVYSMFQKEVEKIKEMGPEERAQMGVPDSVTTFDPFNLLSSKNMVLKFKDKKHISQPSEYWGSSYFTNMFTALVPNIQEAEELVGKAFCLDDYSNSSMVLSEDDMEEQLNFVLFNDSKKKKVPEASNATQEAPSMAQQIMNTQVAVEAPVQQAPVPEVSPAVVENPVQQVPVETPVPEKTPAKDAQTMDDAEFLRSLGIE